MFGYENELVFPIYVSDQNFKDSMELFLLTDNDKSHYLYIKKWFCRGCLQYFSSENVLIKHKENCLSINGKQSIKLEKEIIEFEYYFKQIPVPLKIYAGFECNLLKSMIVLTQKNIKITFLVVLLIKLFVLMIDLLNQLLFIEVKMLFGNLLKQFLMSINIADK